jgi:hypothetical protein
MLRQSRAAACMNYMCSPQYASAMLLFYSAPWGLLGAPAVVCDCSFFAIHQYTVMSASWMSMSPCPWDACGISTVRPPQPQTWSRCICRTDLCRLVTSRLADMAAAVPAAYLLYVTTNCTIDTLATASQLDGLHQLTCRQWEQNVKLVLLRVSYVGSCQWPTPMQTSSDDSLP